MKRCMLLLLCSAALGAQAADSTPAPAPASFQLALVDMQGQKKILGTLPGSVFSPRVSPEGRRVVFEVADPPVSAGAPPVSRLFVAPLDNMDQRTAVAPSIIATRNVAAVWSPDGQWLVFMGSGNGADVLFRIRSNGTGAAQYLLDGRAPEGLYPGNRLAFITLTGNRDYGISLLDIDTRAVTTLVDQPGSEQHSSRLSPDGRWVAYASSETGQQEVWLEPLPQTGQRTRLTQQGGRHPQWSPDGSKIYFDQDGRMYWLDIALDGQSPRASPPRELPIRGFQQGDLRRQYDLMPDGTAFLMLFPGS